MTSPEPEAPRRDSSRGVYGISVAAELAGMGIQSLRLYERRGLLEPDRTEGGTRRYSDDDLARLRRIGELVAEGLNLAGIVLVLQLESDNADLRSERDELRNRESSRPTGSRRAVPHPGHSERDDPYRGPR
jgi:MerR family transcriptional regulator, heat shock protein HspR